jgi:choline-sulfatase
MLRKGRYKLVYHVAGEHELYDLERDPEELTNLAPTPEGARVCAALEAQLREQCDPEEVDRGAKQRQAELIALAGGREAILNRIDYGFSPVPDSVLRDRT